MCYCCSSKEWISSAASNIQHVERKKSDEVRTHVVQRTIWFSDQIVSACRWPPLSSRCLNSPLFQPVCESVWTLVSDLQTFLRDVRQKEFFMKKWFLSEQNKKQFLSKPFTAQTLLNYDLEIIIKRKVSLKTNWLDESTESVWNLMGTAALSSRTGPVRTRTTLTRSTSWNTEMKK